MKHVVAEADNVSNARDRLLGLVDYAQYVAPGMRFRDSY